MVRDINLALKEIVKENKDSCIEFAQHLIKTKSISCTEKAVADLYIHEMKKLGYDEVFRDAIGNVIGLIKFSSDGPTLMYNSHMDHVDEGDRNNWEGYDPYGAAIDGCEVDNIDATSKEIANCIHGRAASDVKGGAAVAVYTGATLIELKKQGFDIKGCFMFTGVVQEEPAETVGMSYLVEKTLPKLGLDYDAVVSSEATSLKLVLGSRGRIEMLVTVYGRTSHGSTPWRGINAIEKAVPVLQEISKLAKTLPYDEDLGYSTLAPTIIDCLPGQLSIIPDQCTISLDRRLLPDETDQIALAQIQHILDQLSEKDAEFKAEVKVKSQAQLSYTGVETNLPKYMLAWKIPKQHPMVVACSKAIEAVGQQVRYGYWDFGTDLSKTAGIDRKPCIGYSPMQEQYAHTPYDKVRCDFIHKAIEGNTSIFITLCNETKETFVKI